MTKTSRIKTMAMKEVPKYQEHYYLHIKSKTTVLNLRALIESGIRESIVSSIGSHAL
jgi:hypothetical protein